MRIDEAFFQNPFPGYGECRRHEPTRVAMPDGTRPWLLTRHADVLAALADKRLSSAVTSSRMMNHTDAPEHTRLRALVARVFGAREVDALRPRIERVAEELLDAWAGRDVVDLIETYAVPLPLRVIGDLVGLPDAEHVVLRELTRDLMNPELMADAYGRLTGHVTEFVARKEPGADLTADLLADRDAGLLTEEELVAMLMLLITAGHETTVQLIGNGVLALLRDPDRWAELTADPGLVPTAVEELLRFDGPINPGVLRVATEEVAFGGAVIPAGDLVLVSLAAANRDPERFPDPDTLRFGRGAHLAFGHGAHYCLGARLARLEGEIALTALLRRHPRVALAGNGVTWRYAISRGVTALPVRPAG
ncbi:cytochrome P450 [Actinosynnema sp. NPDC020468]|uniref:cytochrome P450 family protein n=1 Tax=Actinosynnema sp. NPDC020468 TaxID=3154488 RepID=UPI0033EBDC20